jgi:hypothetical protein
MTSTDIAADYNAFDPGPKHPCMSGGLVSSSFDNDGVQNGTNTSFELLPSNSTYSCISQSSSSPAAPASAAGRPSSSPARSGR